MSDWPTTRPSDRPAKRHGNRLPEFHPKSRFLCSATSSGISLDPFSASQSGENGGKPALRLVRFWFFDLGKCRRLGRPPHVLIRFDGDQFTVSHFGAHSSLFPLSSEGIKGPRAPLGKKRFPEPAQSRKMAAVLNADDTFTTDSVNRLVGAIRSNRPVVIWVGAGASRWAGFPSWQDLAKRMRRKFRNSLGFSDVRAQELILSGDYPALFQLCSDTDRVLYNTTLLFELSSDQIRPLYEQFILKLKRLVPLQIVTTNVDLSLERCVGIADVIEASDIERCGEAIRARVPFVAKLHGSVSSIETVIFTTADYQRIVGDARHVAAVKAIFSMASVIFLGYGNNDEYVLKTLAANNSEHELFGSGPHFLVTSEAGPAKGAVHRIAYSIVHHRDHRAALTVLDVIQQGQSHTRTEVSPNRADPSGKRRESGFFISDFQPSGTRIVGQSLMLKNATVEGAALFGLGFQEGELPSAETVAFHDLAVGLLCFDRVYLPLESLGLVHQHATAPVFWSIVETGAIRFVDVVHQPIFIAKPEDPIGGIGIFKVNAPDESESRSSMSVVRKMLHPIPGHEEEGVAKIEGLAHYIQPFLDSEKLNLPGLVRASLLLPEVSRLLGYSEYIVPSSTPKWLAYPTLRLAHLVQTSLICEQLNIRASRVPFGGRALISASFGVIPAEPTVYDYASFVFTGAYGSNVSGYLERNPNSIFKILEFRESSEGESLRREISDRLENNDGSEFAAAVDGGLKRGIPFAVLQAGRNKFSTLLKAERIISSATTIWANANTDDQSLRLWREKSRELLLERGTVPRDPVKR